MKRTEIIFKKKSLKEDSNPLIIDKQPSELISMVWEITKDNWAFMGNEDAERRLQRHVTTFIKRKS